jgi:hypothetical protein
LRHVQPAHARTAIRSPPTKRSRRPAPVRVPRSANASTLREVFGARAVDDDGGARRLKRAYEDPGRQPEAQGDAMGAEESREENNDPPPEPGPHWSWLASIGEYGCGSCCRPSCSRCC